MGTPTATIRLTKPTVGGDTGPLWPNELNLDMDLLDRAINQTITVSAADINVVLTADGSSSDQALYAIYNITGAWTANRTITLPANVKIGACINGTTGGHSVILSAGGTTLAVPSAAGRMRFEVDGSNNVTSPLVTSGPYNDATTGHVTLPGGFILQWGTSVTPGGGVLAVGFDIAFTSACYAVTATTITTSPQSLVSATIASTGSFNAATFQSGVLTAGVTFYWQAIGR